MAVKLVLSLLTLLALQAAAQEPDYFEIGKNKRFDPKFSGPISSITWKHKGNIIAEYIQGAVDLEYLGDLKGRADVNLTTGVLTVRNMRKSDDGQFTVEINNRVHPVLFTAVGVNRTDSVEVIIRPLTCNSDAATCVLLCGTNLKDDPTQKFFWKKGDKGQWKEDMETITIVNEEGKDLDFGTFSCKAKNVINEKESSPVGNPFKNKERPGFPGPVLAGVLVPLIAGLMGVSGWFIYKKYIKKDESSGQPGPDNMEKANGDEREALNMGDSGNAATSP